jgi:N-acetylglucosaminyldiphosphoundecaprenol N-acetyl-beta-D-mannosaminyltransferase
MLPTKASVLGVGISATSYAQVAAWLEGWIVSRRSAITSPRSSHYICVTSVHGVMLARSDHAFRRILNRAIIATPDGMPVVWALRSFGFRGQARVYGPTLKLRLCETISRLQGRVFLYGGHPETLEVLQKRLAGLFPELMIAGAYSPPFRELTGPEDAAVQAIIRKSDPDLILVGISTPKQERWMWRHRDSFPGAVMVGVGAAFDFHAGRVRQAPSWIQGAGLEWLFRLTMEPARLWKRYLLITPWFLPLWGLQKLGLLNFSVERPLEES